MMDNKRIQATPDQLQVSRHAADALVQVFNMALGAGYATHTAAIDGLVSALNQHEIVIRAQVDFDADGILSFQFLEIAQGREPRPIIDALPTKTLNS